MTDAKRLLAATALLLAAAMSMTPARAECGGSQQCIAVSIDPAVAPAHGTPLTSATLAFGIQQAGTAGGARTIFVGAVHGPAGTRATLDSITLAGTDAADFSRTGGTCTTGTPTLVHAGTACTIEITFNPADTGTKAARVEIATAAITRTVPLAGIGTLTGLPGPDDDPTVRAIVRAQIEAARRISRSQVTNVRRRLESLRGQREAPAPRVGATGMLKREQDPGQNRERARNRDSAWLPEALSGLATARSLDLWRISQARASGARAGATGLWLGGNLSVGSRDASDDSDGLRFSTDGISLGVDRWFGDDLLLGAGAGYAQNETDIGAGGSHDSATAASLSLYASFRPSARLYVDGLIGYGTLSYDTRRYIAAVDASARGRRDGEQWFGSLATGYLYRANGMMLSPYGRLDFSTDTLEQESESGAGNLALIYSEQSVDAARLSLGLRAESPHTTSFGWALPHLRVEWQHDFAEDRSADVAYVDQPQQQFSLAPGGEARDALLLGLGSDFVYRSGLTLGLAYQGLHASDTQEDHTLEVRLTRDLDTRPAPGPGTLELFDHPVQVDAGYGRDDNLNRVREAHDRVDDEFVTLRVGQGTAFALAKRARLALEASLGVQEMREHEGLDRVSADARAALQYRTSSGFTGTTFGLFARAGLDEYDSRLRSGSRYALGLDARKLFTDRIGLFWALEHHVRDGENAVFDLEENTTRLTLDYALGDRNLFYLGAEYRDGDTVSSTPPSTFYTAIADATAADDAYRNRSLTATRYQAETLVWTLGYNRALGARDSIDIAWRRADSEPVDDPAGPVDAGDSGYVSEQLSLHYLMRF